MSGHSKWASIKHKKGALDAKRGKVFTRLIKELTIAARNGGGDPDMNPRLRSVIADAEAANMPADNIKPQHRTGIAEAPGTAFQAGPYQASAPAGPAGCLRALTHPHTRPHRALAPLTVASPPPSRRASPASSCPVRPRARRPRESRRRRSGSTRC